MKNGTFPSSEAIVKYSFLKDDNDNWIQFWYSIIPIKVQHINDQLKTIETIEKELFKEVNIEFESIVMKRLFSSDLTTHFDDIMEYKNREKTDYYISLVEQPSATNIKCSLLGMCLNSIKSKIREDNLICIETKSGVQHIFIEHLIDPDSEKNIASGKQTEVIFQMLKEKLDKFDITIQDNVVRTWIYAPHVDADYPDIVKVRKDLFTSINLTEYTHYIASTGIQGGSGDRYARVFMDAYAVKGVNLGKIRYIQALEHLSPTNIYGVTFERATAVQMHKTDFLFISGTASINKNGDIVHPRDVVKQTERTLENVSALLDSAGYQTSDLSSFIIYLRDASDYEFVKPVMDEYLKDTPAVYVKAPVCRPGWLIEVEATAGKLV